MILAGYELRLRLPVSLRRVEPFWCEQCGRYQSDPGRDGRCERCRATLRRIGP
jgi:hypothetical protein